mgnify:CR=1 FL=1
MDTPLLPPLPSTSTTIQHGTLTVRIYPVEVLGWAWSVWDAEARIIASGDHKHRDCCLAHAREVLFLEHRKISRTCSSYHDNTIEMARMERITAVMRELTALYL